MRLSSFLEVAVAERVGLSGCLEGRCEEEGLRIARVFDQPDRAISTFEPVISVHPSPRIMQNNDLTVSNGKQTASISGFLCSQYPTFAPGLEYRYNATLPPREDSAMRNYDKVIVIGEAELISHDTVA